MTLEVTVLDAGDVGVNVLPGARVGILPAQLVTEVEHAGLVHHTQYSTVQYSTVQYLVHQAPPQRGAQVRPLQPGLGLAVPVIAADCRAHAVPAQ